MKYVCRLVVEGPIDSSLYLYKLDCLILREFSLFITMHVALLLYLKKEQSLALHFLLPRMRI